MVGLALLLAAAPGATPPAPHIVRQPIPFGAARRAETTRYAERHYGIDRHRLVHPHLVADASLPHLAAERDRTCGEPHEPYHRELDTPWRCQTHADWQRSPAPSRSRSREPAGR